MAWWIGMLPSLQHLYMLAPYYSPYYNIISTKQAYKIQYMLNFIGTKKLVVLLDTKKSKAWGQIQGYVLSIKNTSFLGDSNN